ncbi:MAG: peptidyl-prolyl cis-trans isomerase [Verrucomicrobiales bacterium]|nr:peptidyl-prolyl cis-trans isomerase [Verrucomicrobiales bacterium]
MFATIRRHQKWLWIVISTLTIVSFVWFFSPASQSGGGSGRNENAVIGSIYGQPLRRGDYFQAAREARLQFVFNYQQWPGDNPMVRKMGMIERDTTNRLVLLKKIEQFNVQVSEAAVADWIVKAELFQDPNSHSFSKDMHDRMVKEMFPRKLDVRQKDFEDFVRHQVAFEHLINVLGLTGELVTPQEAESLYRRENEQVDTRIVANPSSNFLAQVTLDPAAIATFYTNQQAAYRTPERMQISYVRFDVTNFLSAADQTLAKQDTNTLNQQIDRVYQQRGPDFYKGPNGEPLSPEQAKQRIRDEGRHAEARVEAQKKAIEFMEQLFELKPVGPDNLEKLAAATGYQVAVSQLFSQFEEPPGLDLPDGFARAAFKLTAEEPFLDAPVVTENAVYVVSLKSRHPSAQPPLDQVRERVIADFQKSQARLLAKTAGMELQRKLSAAMAQGKTFETAAAEAGTEVIDLPPISQKTPSVAELRGQADLGAIKNIAFTLTPAQLSGYNETADGGFVLYLEKRVPVTDAQVREALPEYMKTLRQSRRNEAFSGWLRKEMELARITLPGETTPPAQ